MNPFFALDFLRGSTHPLYCSSSDEKLVKIGSGCLRHVALIAAFSCLMLPFETRGHELSDHRNQSSSAKS